ncbi:MULTISPECIES: ubiquinol-cytochrome c reductase iron-sulfur subunit [Marinobacter]|jgi:ubiquinol-cytochrome c reductase iron-sulfur subunit|uniref:ubiquinol-cytochrome c reductase iron-sulfur subunit n=1 Tax=Marinobacter TaxID=2742 RepID=UPI002004AA68|nr:MULTISPECIES: ubiquinol-cytochrome c reductase iron-sulfur subunit [Marinobacter]MCK7552231.1 ubiquinol-cytochrome c reductase iron-sulfur subunit [Marinobacter goseongensis]MDV3505197.1 ubiquinol-cytochrome c reductase iron-sulfur subunit [Marinobacter sp. M-5]
MSNGDVSQGRRRFLIGATSVVGGVGVVGAAVPFVASWNPSAKAEAAGAPVTANVSKLEPGQQMTVEWRGKPVWVVRRTPEMLENIEELNEQVKDPQSEEANQPTYIDGIYRAVKEEYVVLVGICTHLGCSPQFRPEVSPADLGDSWLGGFYCACHGSRYDLSGRVYANQPAPQNLEIPPYRFDDESTLTIGLDPEGAA